MRPRSQAGRGRLSEQAERFYGAFTALARAYQFRDRGTVVCHGLSVSQCYALDALAREGPMSMSRLAGLLFLDVSTMTRIVDGLVAQGVATRVQDKKDRRVCKVRIAPRGRIIHSRIMADLLREYEEVLRAVPAASREAVIASISRILALLRAREQRQAGGCATPG